MDFEVKIHKTGEGLFQTKYLSPHTGKRKRKKFQTLKEAKQYKAEIESKFQNKGLASFSDLRTDQAMKIYIEKFPNSSVRSRQNHFVNFIDVFGNYRISEVRTNELTHWLETVKSGRNLSDKTMNSIRSQFFGFFEFLVNEDYIRINPINKIKFKRHDNPRRPRVVLSIDEVRELLDNAKIFSPKALFTYFYTVAHTGARLNEVLKLQREDVDLKTGLIHFKQTKNGQQRFVKMAPSLMRVLEEHLKSHKGDHVISGEQDTPLTKKELARLTNKFKCYFPNGKNWGCHSLRHSFAYNFLKKGGEMYQLQAILGHRGIQTTIDLYGQLQAQDIENPSPYEY